MSGEKQPLTNRDLNSVVVRLENRMDKLSRQVAEMNNTVKNLLIKISNESRNEDIEIAEQLKMLNGGDDG